MCIYLGHDKELKYEKQEHVIPAALGCCTKLNVGVVSDQANEYFSPIERDVIEHSLIQFFRIIKGPGKRGKLSPKYATTSEVSVIKHGGQTGLGYMKGLDGYILSQFIIDEENTVIFYCHDGSDSNAQNEINLLKEHISEMGEKYVPVNMPDQKDCIYITYFKNKIHIGYREELSEKRLSEIKSLFSGNFDIGECKHEYGQISATIQIREDFNNLCKIVAKTAINTLAYVMGAAYIENTTDFKIIIEMILSDDDRILNWVSGIGASIKDISEFKRKLYLNEEQHACLLISEGKILKAYVFFYERCFEVVLCSQLTKPFTGLIDGIVCNYKKRKDYRYLDYLVNQGGISIRN